MAAVFEGFGPAMNHWNYCYCVTPTLQSGSPPSPWSFQFVSPPFFEPTSDSSLNLYSAVFKPYRPVLEYGFCTARAAAGAQIRLEFGETHTRLQVVFYEEYSSRPLYVTSNGDGGVIRADTYQYSDWAQSPWIKWTRTVTYQIAADDYPRATAHGVFRFRKSDIIAQSFEGQSAWRYNQFPESQSAIRFGTRLNYSLPAYTTEVVNDINLNAYEQPSEWVYPAPPEVNELQLNAPEDIGDVVIAHPIYRHNLHDRNLSLELSAATVIDEGLFREDDARTVKHDVSELTAEPFEFLAPGAGIVNSQWTDAVPSVPAGGCADNGSAGVVDSLVALDRQAASRIGVAGQSLPSLTFFPPATAVRLLARGTKTIDGECRSGDSFFSRYDRPLMEFVVTDYHWSALAVDNVLHATFGAGDTTPFWQPGWSRPAMNPGGFTLTNLNPEENLERL